MLITRVSWRAVPAHHPRAAGRRVRGPGMGRSAVPRRPLRPAADSDDDAPTGPAAPTSPAAWSLVTACRACQVLPLDDRPVVVVAKEPQAVSAERAAEPSILFDGAQCLEKLTVGLVVESRVAAEALALQHVAPAVGKHRAAERPGFERHHR